MPGDEGYGLEPAELDAIVGHLAQAGGDLSKHESALAATPDAGASSEEVATALGMLARVVGGLSREIADASTMLSTNVANYREAELNAQRLLDSTGVTP